MMASSTGTAERYRRLWVGVRQLLALKLSPEQIAAKLRQRHPGQTQLQASQEIIYTAIYAMPKGDLRRELTVPLRQGRAARRTPNPGPGRHGSLQDILSIYVRPPEANDRLVPSHWEGDLIKGEGNVSAVGTLVSRHTLFAILVILGSSKANLSISLTLRIVIFRGRASGVLSE